MQRVSFHRTKHIIESPTQPLINDLAPSDILPLKVLEIICVSFDNLDIKSPVFIPLLFGPPSKKYESCDRIFRNRRDLNLATNLSPAERNKYVRPKLATAPTEKNTPRAP
mmetsp:Transcript_7791/g.9824  ORF Transcript_7791/g.9824 Transcript_7791/m.9824 type:complete len:110 (+) Transcript_7791:336-665(+)